VVNPQDRRRIGLALAELGFLRLRYNVSPDGPWVESSNFGYLFDWATISKDEVRMFYRWYQLYRSKKMALSELPTCVMRVHLRRRKWSPETGATIPPIFPKKRASDGSPGSPGPSVAVAETGSDSTVPGHLTELNCYDLRKR
jgi:hypothetical protein